MAGVYKEVWQNRVAEKFFPKDGWMSELPNEYVEADVVHLADVGTDPIVLVNNTTYPINTVAHTDSSIDISLDQFDTENTSVSERQLFAVSYNVMDTVVDRHVKRLQQKVAQKGLHAIAPTSGANVILATGGAPPAITVTISDLIKMQNAFNKALIPEEGRIAVLHPDHLMQLLETEEKFKEQYHIISSGNLVPKLYGFKIYVSTNVMPVYREVSSVMTKRAWGAAADPALDKIASLFFYKERAFKAQGSTQAYLRPKDLDPENRRNTAGFMQRAIIMPIKADGFYALVS